MMKTKLLNELRQKCKNCKACELYKNRNSIVFSDGNPETAKVVLIGEAPGKNEDLTGKPFVGRAGQLLNEFLVKASFNREKDLYMINTVKCRPPENRVPTEFEKQMCEEFLLKQIKIIEPKLLIFCGATALKSFFKEKVIISKIRGQWLNIQIGEKNYKSMAIFHPSYLLRNYSTEQGSPRELMLKDLVSIKNQLDLK